MADRCFKAWISEIDGDTGENACRWFRVNEVGAFPDKPLFHVLVGSTRTSRYRLFSFWQEIAGDAEIRHFWPQGNTITFVTDIARSGSEFEIDSDLE